MSLETDLFKIPFEWCGIKISIFELIDYKFFRALKSKFPQIKDKDFYILTRELLKYLYLAAKTDGNLFFPGNQDMDQIWHELITETATYRKLCDQLMVGSFVDHTSISYTEYSSMLTSEELHREQLSWLANYIDSFGVFDDESRKD